MTSAEQRTGFRLPWASDAGSGTPANDPVPPDGEAKGETASTEVPSSAEATQMPEATISDSRDLAWPDDEEKVTREGADPAEASAATPSAPATIDGGASAAAPVPSRPRRDNPLVAGLVRAMRDAAAGAREEHAARFAEAVKARLEAIQAESAEEAADLRKRADAEVIEIREWAKAEMARIREETDQRISDRRRRLETEIESHAALVEHRIERVQAAVGGFERRTDAFFERLFAEDDPARLAALAEQLPEAPNLDIDDHALDLPFPSEILDARGAAAAEAEALAGIEGTDPEDGRPEATESASDNDGPVEVDVVRRLAGLSSPAVDLPEAAVTRLAVVGLVSVASIAGFKRALARTHGVRSVSVASGPSGEFVFTVTHDPDTDLLSAVPNLDGFAASITGDADGVIGITASDPESVR